MDSLKNCCTKLMLLVVETVAPVPVTEFTGTHTPELRFVVD